MKKLFVFQENNKSKYFTELGQIHDVINKHEDIDRININELSLERLKNIDVIISNKLPYEWKIMLQGLKIVSIVFDDLKYYDELVDINIDYLYKGNDRLFAGKKFKISNHLNLNIGYEEIFNLIAKLNWDSNFWGFEIAYLSSRHLSDSILYRINQFIINNEVRHIQYLCDCHDRKSVDLAEKNGFKFKDIRLTYKKNLALEGNIQTSGEIKFYKANISHIQTLRELSKDIYKDSRYYFDQKFDQNKIIEFYMLWVEKAVKGEYDDECYIIKINNEILGFCTIRYEGADIAHIGLIGVSKDHTGKGLGRKLIDLIFLEMKNKGIIYIYVVTQGRNYGAQRLYQKTGFLSHSTEIWYHKWNY